MRVSATLAGLGTPSADGEVGILRLGSGATAWNELLFWNRTQQAWVGRPRFSMRMSNHGREGMLRDGDPNTWTYIFSGIDQINFANVNGFGFQIHSVPRAVEMWNAGMRLQEHLSASFAAASAGTAPRLALNWYELDVGDGFLSPVPTNFGVPIVGAADDAVGAGRRRVTGWQNSPVAAPSKAIWYPELYGKDSTQFEIRDFAAYYRWVGGTVAGFAPEGSSTAVPPVLDQLSQWFEAERIPLADGGAVAEWIDYGGYARHISQPVVGKRPILHRGVLNGRAVVRFDGVDDFLLRTTDQISQPNTIFIVMSQAAGGGVQQVWFGNGGIGSPLVYRSDAADLVDVWAGGTDLVYHRGSAWPMPPKILSVELNGASSNVWENKTVVASGNPGGAGLTGLALGGRSDSTLPAMIDVAEVLVYARSFTTNERNTVIDWLNSKYNLL